MYFHCRFRCFTPNRAHFRDLEMLHIPSHKLSINTFVGTGLLNSSLQFNSFSAGQFHERARSFTRVRAFGTTHLAYNERGLWPSLFSYQGRQRNEKRENCLLSQEVSDLFSLACVIGCSRGSRGSRVRAIGDLCLTKYKKKNDHFEFLGNCHWTSQFQQKKRE